MLDKIIRTIIYVFLSIVISIIFTSVLIGIESEYFGVMLFGLFIAFMLLPARKQYLNKNDLADAIESDKNINIANEDEENSEPGVIVKNIWVSGILKSFKYLLYIILLIVIAAGIFISGFESSSFQGIVGLVVFGYFFGGVIIVVLLMSLIFFIYTVIRKPAPNTNILWRNFILFTLLILAVMFIVVNLSESLEFPDLIVLLVNVPYIAGIIISLLLIYFMYLTYQYFNKANKIKINKE